MCSRKDDYNTANNYGFGNEDQYSSLNNGGQRLQVNNFEKIPFLKFGRLFYIAVLSIIMWSFCSNSLIKSQ